MPEDKKEKVEKSTSTKPTVNASAEPDPVEVQEVKKDVSVKAAEAPVAEEPVIEIPAAESSVSEDEVVGVDLLSTEEEHKDNVQAFDFEVSIMALDSKTNTLSICTNLGTAYTAVLGTVEGGSDALTKLASARQTINTNMTADEYDSASTLAAALRTAEKKLTSDVKPVLKSCCQALETYSKAEYSGKKFRDKWNATSTGTNDPFFPGNFRRLWRDQMSEELIVKVGTITKASGAWPATPTVVYDTTDVRVATTAVLPNTPTYDNGTSGVGATLTAGANAALAAIDGVTLAAGDRVLVKNQASALQNGIYVVSSVGSASAPWFLTRATDADTATTEMRYGLATYVTAGSTNGGSKFYMSTNSAVTMGATSLAWSSTTLCSISLDENLEVRVVGNGSLPTTDEIVATLIVQKADLTTSLQTVTIPVGTAVGTRFSIGTSAIKGTGLSAVSIATDNGVDGDMLEIWVKSAA
jgi:hypothetical protein